MSKPSKVPPLLAPRKTPVVFLFPCGCVAHETRGNRVERCDGTACNYSPRKPPGARTYRGR